MKPNLPLKIFVSLITVITLLATACLLLLYHNNNIIRNKSFNINSNSTGNYPIVIATWPYPESVDTAYSTIIETKDSLRSVVDGCSFCEFYPAQCRWAVGYGSKPDETNEVTLDALIMYGPTHDGGAVAQLRNIKNAIGVAQYVLKYTTHSMLVGQDASDFGFMFDFPNESLSSNRSDQQYEDWLNRNCQPNFWRNVYNQSTSCPPYEPIPYFDDKQNDDDDIMDIDGEENHDTIGMIAIDEYGYMTVGESTNGLTYKINGRIGDSPIIGSGAYVVQGVGGAIATGNGDIMMRFNPTFTAVMYMKSGMDVKAACDEALKEILEYYTSFSGAIVCVDYLGNHAAANYGSSSYSPFHYTVRDSTMNESVIVESESIDWE